MSFVSPLRGVRSQTVRGTGEWLGGAPTRELGLTARATVAVAILVMNAVDVVTTRQLLGDGGTELNPLAGRLIEAGALEEVKVGLSLVVGLLVLVAPLRRRTEQLLWGVVVFYAALLTFHLAQLAGLRFA